MRTKDFHPLFFLDILDKEMYIKEIAKKAKCSETTAEKNLKQLIADNVVGRRWRYGMWMYRKLSKKERYDKKWRSENRDRVREITRQSAKRQRERNPEKHREKNREWARTHPKKIRHSQDKWRSNNREYYLMKKRERDRKYKKKIAEKKKKARRHKEIMSKFGLISAKMGQTQPSCGEKVNLESLVRQDSPCVV